MNTQHKSTDAHLNIFHKQRDAIIYWLKDQPILSETKKYFKVLQHIINSTEQNILLINLDIDVDNYKIYILLINLLLGKLDIDVDNYMNNLMIGE